MLNIIISIVFSRIIVETNYYTILERKKDIYVFTTKSISPFSLNKPTKVESIVMNNLSYYMQKMR